MVKMLVRYGPLALRQIKKLKPFNKPKSAPAIKPLTYSAKDKSIFVNVKHKISTSANIARQDKAAKVGRIVEERSLREGLKRIRAKSLSIFGTSGYKTKKIFTAQQIAKQPKLAGANYSIKTAKAKRAIKAYDKAAAKVYKISRAKGLKAYDKASTKLGVGQRRYSARKRQTAFTSDAERRLTGMPPVEYTADMKSFHGVRPAEMVRRHRKTLSKIYTQPKDWKKRSSLIRHYRGAAKTELKQAKIDRNLFREQSVQLQTGTTRKGKPIWKTIRSPEKVYDVHTKRWKRTKIF